MAERLTFSGEQYWDATDRNAYAGAKLYTYEAGTTTPKTTWDSGDESTPNTNPVIADANGIFPPIYGDGSYLIDIYNSDDSEHIYQEDNVASSEGAGSSDTFEINNLPEAKTTDLSEYDSVYIQSLTAGWEDTVGGPVDGFYAHSDGTTGTPGTGDENQFFDVAGNGFTRDDNQRLDEQIENDVDALKGLYDGYFFGIDTDSSDGDNVVVGAGKCGDSTGALIIDVASQSADIKSRISAGGNLSGAASPAIDTGYFLFVVSEADGANPRLAFDTSSGASNALSEWSTETGNTYTLYRLIGFAITDSTPDIKPFTHKDNLWVWDVPIQSSVVTSTTTNIWSVAISSAGGLGAIPAGVDVNPVGALKAYDASAVMYGLITGDYQADTAPTVNLSTFALNTQGPVSCALDQYISNGSINVRFSSSSSVDFAVLINGWKYNR